MQLKSPFVISARLRPALRIGDAWLSLDSVSVQGQRHNPLFLLDVGSECFRIDDIRSGCGGFRSPVEAFATLLSFMSANAESIEFTERTGLESDNSALFNKALTEWIAKNASNIECVMCEICDESGETNHSSD